MAAGTRPDPLGELKRSPRPLAVVKGLGPPGREGKGEGKGRRGREREGREGEGRRREKGWKRRGGERGGTGPQFKKNDPPSSDGWLRACGDGAASLLPEAIGVWGSVVSSPSAEFGTEL